MISEGAGDRSRLPADIHIRSAGTDDLAACAGIWRDGINDYIAALNQPVLAPEVGPIGRLHAHLLATDPERFLVADRNDGAGPIAFGAAVRRDQLWFLSMLFVRPGEQGRGLGRAILTRLLPDDDAVLATATDSLQPISNALYAAHGMVARMPLLSLLGRPRDDATFPVLPGGVRPQAFEDVAGIPGGTGHRDLVEAVDALDRQVAGFSHPQDHRFLRMEGRRGFLYRAGDGSAVAYGYASEVGRLGPVAAIDEALVAPVLGHLLETVRPRDASIAWVPGQADRAVVWLLQAGLRLDGFPVLLGWNRPFADFARYLPISPGLL